MASEPNKSDKPSAERLSKPEGFDTKKNQPGATARPDPGAVPPVDPVPDAGVAKAGGGERKRRKRFTQLLSEPERAMAKDAHRAGPAARAEAPGALHSRSEALPQHREARSVGGLQAEARTEARPASCPAHRSCCAEAGPWHEMGRAIPTVHS